MGASGGGDAEGMMRSLILGYGGVPVDKDNKITINSKETLEALKMAASFYRESLTPPAAVTWDDASNNIAYLAGTVGLIMNSGSVMTAMKKDKQDLMNNRVVPSSSAFLLSSDHRCTLLLLYADLLFQSDSGILGRSSFDRRMYQFAIAVQNYSSHRCARYSGCGYICLYHGME
jgi:ABC-type glycerol-3-phosphate transport system substrate-binding protein